MEDYVIKQVDVQQQPHLVGKLPQLQEMYKATKAIKHLIRSEEGPHIGSKYTVTLSPFDEQLGSGTVSTRITSLAQLQAAIRCILLALQDLHAASFAHTDIWWPNVIKCSKDLFYLIDLEMAVKLGCTWSVREHGPHLDAWTTLWSEAGTQQSRVGRLLTEPGLPPLGESGHFFAQELMAKSLSLQSAMHHVWFQS